ncbi:MAG: PASTA domain-containing protein [Candidatus Hydrogenedens sp.]
MVSIILFISESSHSVIEINNIVDMQKIGNDAGYPLDVEYELTQDIDASDTINWNSGAGFVPIGTESNPFIGKFDGNGHKIRRLYINCPEQNYVGLFGNVGGGGEVTNLGIEEGWVIGGGDDTGILVGRNNGGIVRNCYSTGRVSCSGEYVGGLVGYDNRGTVSQSYWDVETSGQSSSAGGTGKTTAQMKQQATYVGWDFVYVWGIVENSSYPYLLWKSGSLQLITVPDVVGMSQSSAESAITGAGLTVGMVTQQCSNTVSSGNVISQNPIAGQQVNPGSAVNLVVSSGPCPEGEGIVEGEGSPEGIVEGTSEGEGVVEGEGSVQPKEGENTPEANQGCGCFGGKSLGDEAWWKYLLDFVLVGILILTLSGMRRKK